MRLVAVHHDVADLSRAPQLGAELTREVDRDDARRTIGHLKQGIGGSINRRAGFPAALRCAAARQAFQRGVAETRLSVVGVAAVTGAMALSRNNIYELVGESSALSLVSLFVPLIGGLYWRRASMAGAIASMVAGMAVWLLALWWSGLTYTESPMLQQLAAVPPMLYGLAASITAMLLGSWLYPERRLDPMNEL